MAAYVRERTVVFAIRSNTMMAKETKSAYCWSPTTTLHAHEGRLGKILDTGDEVKELEGAQLGTRVRVQLDYKEPQRQGAVGTIQKRYEVPEYTAFEVLFSDGQMELFWEHQLEEAREPSSRTKRWWAFW